MNARKFPVVSVIAAALLAPMLSMADTPWVPANNERGYTYQPEHATGTPRGAQGRSAVRTAAPDGLLREGAPLDTFPGAAAGKTREQVRNELLSMSPAERQRMQELFRGN